MFVPVVTHEERIAFETLKQGRLSSLPVAKRFSAVKSSVERSGCG
jgi:hypothetical protein